MIIKNEQIIDAFNAARPDDEFVPRLRDLEDRTGVLQSFHIGDDRAPGKILCTEDHFTDPVLLDVIGQFLVRGS